ncbi:MAG TPA: metal ABC transporter permease [Chloroflexota bacterium]|nr:metal ABC transporter permease [Chloroflexota bacterium]
MLIGAVFGLIGTLVISRGMAFLGDALAKPIFPGVVIALCLYLGSLIGAVSAAALTVAGIGVIVAETVAGGILWFSRLPSYLVT